MTSYRPLTNPTRHLTPVAAASVALILAACGGADPAAQDAAAPSADGAVTTTDSAATTADAAVTTAADPAAAATEDDARETAEAAGPSPRLGVTYDGGVMVVDGSTLEVLGDFPAEGFTRLNPVGDTRHLLLSEGSTFRVLDTGAWSEPHGDHDHSYATDPSLTDLTFDARTPGHVVHHAGRTILFDDGTGEISSFDPEGLADGELPEVERSSTQEAHHGVAVELADGSMVRTDGTEGSVGTVVATDGEGEEIARDTQCPGVHGETVAADEVVVVGCEDGVLMFRDGAFTKVDAEEEYARIGNLAGHEDSPVVLGDYKTDPDADLERPTTVSLVDTATGEIRLVQLPASYTFRSLARDADGSGLVLGTDGMLRTLDVDSGEIMQETPVVQAWEEPADWQEPRPSVKVLGGLAYVSEPATQELHIVDLRTDEVIDSAELPEVPNEIGGVTG